MNDECNEDRCYERYVAESSRCRRWYGQSPPPDIQHHYRACMQRASTRFDLGQLLTTKEYLDDKLDGISIMWNNDIIILQSEYLSGKLHGKTVSYSNNGLKIIEKNYINGKLHGKYQSWWDNGNKKELGYYDDGIRVGEYIWYTTKGELWRKYNFSKVSRAG